jgi:hypothetical protein
VIGTIVLSMATQIQLFAISDGHSLASIPFSVTPGQSWSQIASDGSYLCTGSPSGLTVWSPDGQSEFTIAGDYHAVSPYAAPGQVQIANGPAGSIVIQTVSVPSGDSSTGPQFSGTFSSWFLDGQSFFTNMSNNVWIYSTEGTQKAYLTTLPSSQGLIGNGDLFWLGTSVYSVSTGSLIQAYPSVPTFGRTSFWASGTTIAIAFYSVNPTVPEIQIVDLSGSTPVATIQAIGQVGPLPWQLPTLLPVFAWQNSQAWVLAGPMIADGPSLSSTTPRYFGDGQPSDMAGASNLVALSTATGLHLLNPITATDIGDFGYGDGFGLLGGFVPQNMALSTDGSVLAAYDGNFGGPPPTPTLNVYSLPAMSTVGNFSYPQSLLDPFLVSFGLSGSGTTLGQVIAECESLINGGPFTRQVTGVSGTPTIWSDSDDGSWFSRRMELSSQRRTNPRQPTETGSRASTRTVTWSRLFLDMPRGGSTIAGFWSAPFRMRARPHISPAPSTARRGRLSSHFHRIRCRRSRTLNSPARILCITRSQTRSTPWLTDQSSGRDLQ